MRLSSNKSAHENVVRYLSHMSDKGVDCMHTIATERSLQAQTMKVDEGLNQNLDL